MTTKHPMPEPHVHAELMMAKAEGAVIEYEIGGVYVLANNPMWYEDATYRIDPTCDYAKAKIAELGGDDMVELYIYWLDGGEVCSISNGAKVTLGSDSDNPFSLFYEVIKDNEVIKKKRMVKQVLWVDTRLEKGKHMHHLWRNIEKGAPRHAYWHKVPSCTREVEGDV